MKRYTHLIGVAAMLGMVGCGGNDLSQQLLENDHAYPLEDEMDRDVSYEPQTTCGASLSRYPVNGKHNGGYDSRALTYTCPGHPSTSPDNSDFIAGNHLGNDIFAARGTPVVAGRGGKVVRRGWDSTGGNRVTIQDSCGWWYYYAHLDTITAPAVGNSVSAGQKIGTVGNTGNASGTSPHLHFSIYPDGNYSKGINPFPHLKSADSTACR